MKSLDLTIEQSGEKGRAFSISCLAYIEADGLWSAGGGSNIRPVFAVLAGSVVELNTFLANWQSGRRASYPKNRYSQDPIHMELLRSVTYRRADQRTGDLAMATVFVPDLFSHDPGMVDPEGVRFLCLPPASWLEDRTAEHDLDAALEGEDGLISGGMPHDRKFARLAIAVLSQLDRRTRAPVIQSPAFAVRLLARLLEDRVATLPDDHDSHQSTWGVRAFGLDNVGAAGCVAVNVAHEKLEKILAEEARDYLRSQARRAA